MKLLFRLICAVVALSAIYMIPSPAAAGTYQIKSCWNNPSPNWQAILGQYWTNAPSKFDFDTGECRWNGTNIFGYQIASMDSAVQDDVARVKFSTVNNYLGISGVGFTYIREGSSWNGWSNNFFLHDNGANVVTIPSSKVADKLQYTLPSGGTRSDFTFNVKCSNPTCPGGAFIPYTNVEEIGITVKDLDKPDVYHVGSLFGGGVVSGVKKGEAVGWDGGSGVWRVAMIVNGQWAATSDAPGVGTGVSCDPNAPTYNAYEPCPHVYSKEWNFNTAQAPFVEGANQVNACVIDYSRDATCLAPTTVYVDN